MPEQKKNRSLALGLVAASIISAFLYYANLPERSAQLNEEQGESERVKERESGERTYVLDSIAISKEIGDFIGEKAYGGFTVSLGLRKDRVAGVLLVFSAAMDAQTAKDLSCLSVLLAQSALRKRGRLLHEPFQLLLRFSDREGGYVSAPGFATYDKVNDKAIWTLGTDEFYQHVFPSFFPPAQ